MNVAWYMARRLYGEKGTNRRASRSAIFIATVGVALGIAVMVIAISVVLGFKREVQDKVTGIGAHIQILNYMTLNTPEYQPIAVGPHIMKALRKMPEVANVHLFCQKTGMLKTEDGFQGVAFRGINADYDLSFLRSCLLEGELDTPFSSDKQTGRLLVSKLLADQLNLSVGDRVYAYFFDERLRARRFTVSAIYATHISEYDSKLVFCDYRTTHQLLGFEDNQSSGVEVTVSDMDAIPVTSLHISDLVGGRQDPYGAYFTTPTIRETFPHIFAWLDLLDLNVIVILLLMVAVAGFTTISGLLIIILERTQFIGVMKALGASNTSLRHLFLYWAILIVGRGMLLGNVIGISLCWLQSHFHIIGLDAATYYVSYVPILIHWEWVVIVNLATFLIATLALLLPSLVVSNIHPARSICFE